LQNNDPKSENKALKERAAKTKDVEGRLKGMAREHMRPREKVLGGTRTKREVTPSVELRKKAS
jgi:hypothetical protein